MITERDDRMVLFICEDSIDGIFTGVYDAWASRLGHSNVGLRVQGQMNLELFAEYQEVQTDPAKAEKVARSIRAKAHHLFGVEATIEQIIVPFLR